MFLLRSCSRLMAWMDGYSVIVGIKLGTALQKMNIDGDDRSQQDEVSHRPASARSSACFALGCALYTAPSESGLGSSTQLDQRTFLCRGLARGLAYFAVTRRTSAGKDSICRWRSSFCFDELTRQ